MSKKVKSQGRPRADHIKWCRRELERLREAEGPLAARAAISRELDELLIEQDIWKRKMGWIQ